MKWGDVKLCTTNTGTEYLQYSERVTKTRTGANPGNTREVTPVICEWLGFIWLVTLSYFFKIHGFCSENSACLVESISFLYRISIII
jgi:hypothetical protein